MPVDFIRVELFLLIVKLNHYSKIKVTEVNLYCISFLLVKVPSKYA